MQSSSLSEAKIIEKLSANFVPVKINLTDQGFPKDVPALKLWEKAFDSKTSNKFGFATSIVIEPKARFPLGTSGSGHLSEAETCINYSPEKYLKYLDVTLDRLKRARAIETEPGLTAEQRKEKSKVLGEEILQSIQKANEGYLRKKS